MRMSDMIEEFIKELFEEDNDYIEIQRNDLAEHFNCVPSQINYVISTRFKPSQGYYVESKRGGGGHITIKKINITKSNYIMHIISSIEDSISAQEVDIFISNLLSYQIITEEQENAYSEFCKSENEKLETVENLLRGYSDSPQEKFTPKTLLIDRDGSYALLCDDIDNEDEGIAVCLYPQEVIISQDDYL